MLKRITYYAFVTGKPSATAIMVYIASLYEVFTGEGCNEVATELRLTYSTR